MKNSTKHFFTAEYAKVIINRPLCLSTSTSSSTSLSTSSSSSTCTSNTNTTIHLEIDLKNTKIKYQTADNLAILPENSFENVQRFAFCMKYDLNQWVKIETKTKNGEIPFPTPCTIGTILTKYLDIHSSPRKASLRQLAFFTKKKRSRIFITTLFKRKRIFKKKNKYLP
jgi:NADPH-ferrihemoprotein reductase